MDVRVTIQEIQTTNYTYSVENVKNLAEAKEIAMKCYRTHFAPRSCYLYRTVPQPMQVKFDALEIVSTS